MPPSRSDKDLNLTPEMLAQRQLQTRRFETTDEQKILKTCAALLAGYGLQHRRIRNEARDPDRVKGTRRNRCGAVGRLSSSVSFFGVTIPPDKDQIMKAFVTTRPVGDSGRQVAVRVVFERIVFDTEHRIKKIEALNDPKIYQSFFEKLSKALFLEAHDI